MFYALAFNANGSVLSRLEYSEDVESFPENQIPCTEEQFLNYRDFHRINDFIVPLSSSEILRNAMDVRVLALRSRYLSSLQGKLKFSTGAGVSEVFQVDDLSVKNLSDMLLAFSGTQETPDQFYWVTDNNSHVPFTYKDLQGLASLMGTAKLGLFQHFQGKRAEIEACTTVEAVNAVQW